MANRFRLRVLLPLTALGVAGLLGGCVAYPAYPAYGYAAPYYGGGYVELDGGWHGHHDSWGHDGWRHDGWGHEGGWRR